MDKPTKKRQTYNPVIITELKNRYGYSKDYILKSLRGDRVGVVPDMFIKEYKQMEKAAIASIKKVSENFNP